MCCRAVTRQPVCSPKAMTVAGIAAAAEVVAAEAVASGTGSKSVRPAAGPAASSPATVTRGGIRRNQQRTQRNAGREHPDDFLSHGIPPLQRHSIAVEAAMNIVDLLACANGHGRKVRAPRA